MSLQKMTRIGIHQCADSGPHLNSTTGGNTHNALCDAFVLNWRHFGALTHFLSKQGGYFKISLVRGPRANERWRGWDAQSDQLTAIFCAACLQQKLSFKYHRCLRVCFQVEGKTWILTVFFLSNPLVMFLKGKVSLCWMWSLVQNTTHILQTC